MAEHWKRRLKRATAWRIEGWLLAWMENAEPSYVPDLRLLAETDDGDLLVPVARLDGEPYWEGYWRWWKPTHWPPYIRSRRHRTYVMVERWVDQ